MERIFHFTRESRKHKIGKARIFYVIENSQPIELYVAEGNDRRIKLIGQDQRGLELEIIGVVLSGKILIIHVMPSKFRKR